MEQDGALAASWERESTIDTPSQAVAAAGDLWTSLTESWLTSRSPANEDTRWPWPVTEEWLGVQRAAIRGGAAGIERIRDGKREADLWRLMPRLVGDPTSFAVIVGAQRLSDTIAWLVPAIHELDSVVGKQVLDPLFGMQAERHLTLVIAAHDTALAERCQRVVEPSDGCVVNDVLAVAPAG